MSNAYNLEFTRWTKRGVSDLTTITAMEAMTEQAYQRMADSSWSKLSEKSSDVPPHKYTQTGFSDRYDAAKYCGDYSSGKQKAYACAVCYSIHMPADALVSTIAKVESIAATLFGDRWTACGGILSAFLTSSSQPPSWSDVLSASYTSPTPVTSSGDVDPTWQAPLRQITRSNDGDDNSCQAVLPIASGVNSTAYLHIVLRLGDYLSSHGAWIEGGIMLLGESLLVTFDRAVTVADYTLTLKNEFSGDVALLGAGTNNNLSIINTISAARLRYSVSYAPADQLGDATMMRKILGSRQFFGSNQISGGIAHVSNSFATYPAKVGIAYNQVLSGSTPIADEYWMFGMFCVRGSQTNGETATGLSFSTAIPTLPAGQIVRVSVYGHDGTLPLVYMFPDHSSRLEANIISLKSALDDSVIRGTATSVELNQYSTATNHELDTLFTYPSVNASVHLLGSVDLDGVGFATTSVIPFLAPWAMSSYVCVAVSIAVVGYTDSWVPSSKTSTAVAWQPGNFILHLAD